MAAIYRFKYDFYNWDCVLYYLQSIISLGKIESTGLVPRSPTGTWSTCEISPRLIDALKSNDPTTLAASLAQVTRRLMPSLMER